MGFCWDIHVSPEEVKKQIYGFLEREMHLEET